MVEQSTEELELRCAVADAISAKLRETRDLTAYETAGVALEAIVAAGWTVSRS